MHQRRSRLATCLWASFAALGLLALPREASAAQINSPVSVVTSNTVLADLVRNVGGDTTQVHSLTPAGVDPHTFQPTPDSIRLLSQARVVFFNGAGLEEWWDKTIRSVKKPDVPIVELSKGLATLRTPGHSHGPQNHADVQDPHVWLDPTLARAYVERTSSPMPRAAAVSGCNSTKGSGMRRRNEGWLRCWLWQYCGHLAVVRVRGIK